MSKVKVAIIMGSQSDMRIMKDAVQVLKDFKVSHKVEVVSAHRTPEKMYTFSKEAHLKYDIIIAGAGGAAHLPGMVASLTSLPVIGVPVKVGKIKGIDSLVSIAQMPKGVPVASMAVDNAYNAALFAVRILALNNKNLEKRLSQYKTGLKKKINLQNSKLRKELG